MAGTFQIWSWVERNTLPSCVERNTLPEDSGHGIFFPSFSPSRAICLFFVNFFKNFFIVDSLKQLMCNENMSICKNLKFSPLNFNYCLKLMNFFYFRFLLFFHCKVFIFCFSIFNHIFLKWNTGNWPECQNIPLQGQIGMGSERDWQLWKKTC